MWWLKYLTRISPQTRAEDYPDMSPNKICLVTERLALKFAINTNDTALLTYLQSVMDIAFTSKTVTTHKLVTTSNIALNHDDIITLLRNGSYEFFWSIVSKEYSFPIHKIVEREDSDLWELIDKSLGYSGMNDNLLKRVWSSFQLPGELNRRSLAWLITKILLASDELQHEMFIHVAGTNTRFLQDVVNGMPKAEDDRPKWIDSALFAAVKKGNVESVKALLAAGADPNDNPDRIMQAAIYTKNMTVMKMIAASPLFRRAEVSKNTMSYKKKEVKDFVARLVVRGRLR